MLSLVTFSLHQPKRKRAPGHLCFHFMQLLYTGAVAGSALSVAVRVTGVLRVYACLWRMSSFSLLVEAANRQAAAASLGLGLILLTVKSPGNMINLLKIFLT